MYIYMYTYIKCMISNIVQLFKKPHCSPLVDTPEALRYRGTSLMRNTPPPQGRDRALDTVLL